MLLMSLRKTESRMRVEVKEQQNKSTKTGRYIIASEQRVSQPIDFIPLRFYHDKLMYSWQERGRRKRNYDDHRYSETASLESQTHTMRLVLQESRTPAHKSDIQTIIIFSLGFLFRTYFTTESGNSHKYWSIRRMYMTEVQDRTRMISMRSNHKLWRWKVIKRVTRRDVTWERVASDFMQCFLFASASAKINLSCCILE